MKKLGLLLIATALMIACSSNNSNNAKKDSCCDKNETKKAAVKAEVKTLEQLFNNAEESLNKMITVKGMVSHVCQHSGRKCFLENKDASLSFRIEAGKAKGFPRELSGTDITVTGIVKGQKITKEQIDAFEKRLAEQEKAEGEGHCATENNAVTKMRNWMIENKKDYYLNLFMVCETYSIN